MRHLRVSFVNNEIACLRKSREWDERLFHHRKKQRVLVSCFKYVFSVVSVSSMLEVYKSQKWGESQIETDFCGQWELIKVCPLWELDGWLTLSCYRWECHENLRTNLKHKTTSWNCTAHSKWSSTVWSWDGTLPPCHITNWCSDITN